MPEALTLAEFVRLTGDPERVEALSAVAGNLSGAVLVDCRGAGANCPPRLNLPHCVIIGIHAERDLPVPRCIDVVAESDAACAHLLQRIGANPLAAATLVDLLRHEAWSQVDTGLTLESLAYSTLQHGQEFERWLSTRTSRMVAPAFDPVLIERSGDALTITLNQPARRNAFSAAMRDALCESLKLVLLDASIRNLTLCGAGPSFCAGGDLDEFGSQRDAAIAHAGRLSRSTGRLLHQLADRTTCKLQGACIGAGIELPAFAGRIEARADAFFELPEVGMGLIPGAGGTVSIPRRIGRLRTARMALGGERLSADIALQWGLVDAIVG
jgi:enoyl-CoA hydratase/carnithine racemase